jgi:hypothetical protein
MANTAAIARGVAGSPSSRPIAASPRQAEEIVRGPRVWEGCPPTAPTAPCTARFALSSTSRIVADDPLRGGVYKCRLQSVG